MSAGFGWVIAWAPAVQTARDDAVGAKEVLFVVDLTVHPVGFSLGTDIGMKAYTLRRTIGLRCGFRGGRAERGGCAVSSSQRVLFHRRQ